MQPWYCEYQSDNDEEDEKKDFLKIAQREKAAQTNLSLQMMMSSIVAPDGDHHETYIDKEDLFY